MLGLTTRSTHWLLVVNQGTAKKEKLLIGSDKVAFIGTHSSVPYQQPASLLPRICSKCWFS